MHINTLNAPNPIDTSRITMDFFARRKENADLFQDIDTEIQRLFERRFITYPATSRFIEALIEMSECKRILELGFYTGFTTLHMIRGVYPDGVVYSVEHNPELAPGHFFDRPEIKSVFRFVRGKTPDILSTIPSSEVFDLVFIDSDHSIVHNEKERLALWPMTRPGTLFVYHDAPPLAALNAQELGPVYRYLMDLVVKGVYVGGIFQTPHRLDCLDMYQSGYDPRLLPHLGVFMRV